MHDTGCSGLVQWDDPEGWYVEGGGRGVQDGEHGYTSGRFMLMYGKTNILYNDISLSFPGESFTKSGTKTYFLH